MSGASGPTRFTSIPSDSRTASNSAVNLVDRKSTRLNSSHLGMSYAVCCLKKTSGQRLAGEPLHDQERPAVGADPMLVQRRHVRRADAAQRLGLAAAALEGGGAVAVRDLDP